MSDVKRNDEQHGGLGEQVYDRYATDPGVIQTTSGFGLGGRMSEFAISRAGLMREIQGRWSPENAPRQTMPAIDRVWSQSPFASVSRSMSRFGSNSQRPAAPPMPAVLMPASSGPANAELQEKILEQPASASVDPPTIYHPSPQSAITSNAPLADISEAKTETSLQAKLANASSPNAEADAPSKLGLRDEERIEATQKAISSSGSVIEAPHSEWQRSERVLQDVSRPDMVRYTSPSTQVARYTSEHPQTAEQKSSPGGQVEASAERIGLSVPIDRPATRAATDTRDGQVSRASHSNPRSDTETGVPGATPVPPASASMANTIAAVMQRPILSRNAREAALAHRSAETAIGASPTFVERTGDRTPPTGLIENRSVSVKQSAEAPRVLRTSMQGASGATVGDSEIQDNNRHAISSGDLARVSILPGVSIQAGKTSPAEPIHRSPDASKSESPSASGSPDNLASPGQTIGALQDRKEGTAAVAGEGGRTLSSQPLHRASPIVLRSSSGASDIPSSSNEGRNSFGYAQAPSLSRTQSAGASVVSGAPLVLAAQLLSGSSQPSLLTREFAVPPRVNPPGTSPGDSHETSAMAGYPSMEIPIHAVGPVARTSAEAMTGSFGASSYSASASNAQGTMKPFPVATGGAAVAIHRASAAVTTGGLRPTQPEAKVVVPVHRSTAALMSADVRPAVHSRHQELLPEPRMLTELPLGPAAAPPSRTFLQRTATASPARVSSSDQTNSSPRPPLPSASRSSSSALPEANLAQIANRVYDLLVRRLANERQRRGA
jgi:hypothetical protein